jgi:hypothetical protein
MQNFNINEYISVQLTDAGRAELERQHEELRTEYPKAIATYLPPKEDVDGWSKWQGWCLMSTFGHMMQLGRDLPFFPAVKFDTQQ